MKKSKKIIKVILCVVLAVVLIVAGYFAYVFIDYHRIGDGDLEVENKQELSAQTGIEYKLVSYNIGFGAYESDYDFFMDGGKQSWAWSKERLEANLMNICQFLKEQEADFYSIQEVDLNSTRSYHVDETMYIKNALSDWSNVITPNYDSPFLFYPLTQPHGKSQSSLMTLAKTQMTSAVRRELPVENSVKKLLDLDRCYSVVRIPVANGKELLQYNMHLSAYTSDGKIAFEQLKIMMEDMQNEYEKGNYILCAGDFNKDLLGNSSKYFGKADVDYTWAQPIPDGTFDGYNLSLVVPFNENKPIPSARNADAPYHEGQFVVTIDGFIVSDNIEVVEADVYDIGFAYSDHNPAYMSFILAD